MAYIFVSEYERDTVKETLSNIFKNNTNTNSDFSKILSLM